MSAAMNNSDYKALDDIAFSTTTETIDEELLYGAIDAIAARGEDGLRGLVERYAKSKTPEVGRGISFALAKAADSVTPRTCTLVYEFWDALSVKDDDSTLMNCLTAIQRQEIAGIPWRPQEYAPKALYDLIDHCLNRGELVQSSALDLLARLYEDGRFETAFSSEHRGALVERLSSLAATESKLLQMSLAGLRSAVDGGTVVGKDGKAKPIAGAAAELKAMLDQIEAQGRVGR